MSRRVPWFVYTVLLAAVLACVGAAGLVLGAGIYEQQYDGRIFAGVNVYGAGVGGLTPDEAAALLASSLADPRTIPLTLQYGERTWSRSWADLGLYAEPAATAQLAYRVGREGAPSKQQVDRLRALVSGWPVSPVLVLPDSVRATEALQALAPELAIPPVNASLLFGPDGVVPVPAQAGRELDVEAIVSALAQVVSIREEGIVVQLMTRQVEPPIGNPGPAQGEAEALLAQPFVLVADDLLTGLHATWVVEPATVAGWLSTREVVGEGKMVLALTTQEEAVRAFLEGLAGELPGDVALDVAETAEAVRAAVGAGEQQAAAVVVHPPQVVTVQPGETLLSISQAHGFPLWRFIEANPTLDPGGLLPGQQVTVPSLDVLFPYPLIVDRRIVVDMSDQYLYAYQGESLVYAFPCSTGIASSPTLVGTFQVLSLEENAYASNWDLWMPHFIGIYYSGPDFVNGIHGLPTLSNGTILWEGYLGKTPISYGCIVIGLSEAASLFSWVETGVLVTIQE